MSFRGYFFSERQLQRELDATRGRDSVGRCAEAGRFKQTDGDAVVGAVDEVEDLHAEVQARLLARFEGSAERRVQIEHVAGAETVAPDLTVLSDGREQRLRINCQPQRLTAIARDHDAVRRVQAISQIAVEVHVEDRVDREGLTRLETAETRQLPTAQDRMHKFTAPAQRRQIEYEVVSEAVAHVEISWPALGCQVEAVLRQGRRAREIEHVRYIVGRF